MRVTLFYHCLERSMVALLRLHLCCRMSVSARARRMPGGHLAPACRIQ